MILALENKTISILGLGWLGSFLAQHLEQKGYAIKASTTTPQKLNDLKASGYSGFLINLDTEQGIPAEFSDSPIHFICIPPSKIEGDYADTLAKYVSTISEEVLVFFISSTSVYPDISGDYLEKDHAGHGKMLQAENVISSRFKKHFILRCSGLFGGDRDPGNFLAGKVNLKGPFTSVNLIHAMDICEVVEKLLSSKIHGIYNLSVTAPYNKKEFYTKASRKISNAPPIFNMKSESYKRTINTKKAEHLTKVDFRFTKAYFASLN
jgi:nucleoside-diphosphate-sugar epimerase